MLPGSLKAVAQVLFAPEQARQAMAERKTEVFGQFATLHPEARFVFIGDSGEGDVDFAEEFMGQAGGPARRAALIHDVVRPEAKRIKASSFRFPLLFAGPMVWCRRAPSSAGRTSECAAFASSTHTQVQRPWLLQGPRRDSSQVLPWSCFSKGCSTWRPGRL